MIKSGNYKAAKRVVSIIFSSVGIILLILSIFVSCVENFAFNRNYYREEYMKLSTADYVGVSTNTLFKATDILLEYLEGERDNIDYQYSNEIETREFYTGREKAHMLDVAALNKNAVGFAEFGFPAGAVLLVISYLILKRPYILFKTIFITTIAVIGFFTYIGVWAAIDFDQFWISFHKLFFNNDLWLLDPRSSLMVRMFSAEFFFDMVVGILSIFIMIIVAILVVSGVLSRKFKENYRV